MKITNLKNITNIAMVIIISASFVSCFNKEKPNYQYMPNMYEPIDYKTYGEYDIFSNKQEAMIPPKGTIPRGWQPYEYENSTEGLELARSELKNPLNVTEENLAEGKKLFSIYCAVCHGDKGDGQGILVKREKFLGIPSYADPGRIITEGSIYHVMMYGINTMGSYASQTNEKERWQIDMYVINLKAGLKGEPLLQLTDNDTIKTEMKEVTINNSEEEQ